MSMAALSVCNRHSRTHSGTAVSLRRRAGPEPAAHTVRPSTRRPLTNAEFLVEREP